MSGLGFGFWVLDSGFCFPMPSRPRTLGFGFWVLGFGFRDLGSDFPWALARAPMPPRPRMLGFGFWVLGFGIWVLISLGCHRGAGLVRHLLASLQAKATGSVRQVVIGFAARAPSLEEPHSLDQAPGREQRCRGEVCSRFEHAMLTHGAHVASRTDGHILTRRQKLEKPFHVGHGRQRCKDARQH